MSFSERMGLVPSKAIQKNSLDDRLRNRLYNFFMGMTKHSIGNSLIPYVLDQSGKIIIDDVITNDETIKEIFFDKTKWYLPYDIIEYAIEFYMSHEINDGCSYTSDDYTNWLNDILIKEKSGYRLINGKFCSITDETELTEIQNAMNSDYKSVDEHIKKALALYSDRDNPDYENSIKESISAVESMCCIITGQKGGQATLGAALNILNDNGISIHSAMKVAYSKLYGYTSDQSGIRHGSITFEKAPEEDARYMLVSCSAFVNYLKDKYSKLKIKNKD